MLQTLAEKSPECSLFNSGDLMTFVFPNLEPKDLHSPSTENILESMVT